MVLDNFLELVDVLISPLTGPDLTLFCHFKLVLLGRHSEIFGPFWQSTSSSKSIWLSISPKCMRVHLML